MKPVEIIDRLKTEHRNLAQVLKCLEQQLDVLEHDGDANYPLMQNVLHYIVLFPDQVHHPNEELIFAELRRVRPDAEKAVATLSEEHHSLGKLSHELEQMIDAAANEHIVSRAALIKAGREFLQIQFDHMRFEEDKLFPMFLEVFSSTEKPLPKIELHTEDDPLFTKSPQENLALLHQTIMDSKDELANDQAS